MHGWLTCLSAAAISLASLHSGGIELPPRRRPCRHVPVVLDRYLPCPAPYCIAAGLRPEVLLHRSRLAMVGHWTGLLTSSRIIKSTSLACILSVSPSSLLLPYFEPIPFSRPLSHLYTCRNRVISRALYETLSQVGIRFEQPLTLLRILANPRCVCSVRLLRRCAFVPYILIGRDS